MPGDGDNGKVYKVNLGVSLEKRGVLMTLFEMAVIFLTVAIIWFLSRKDSDILKKFIITFLGVLLFEYFTQALWINKNLASWSYLYLDVSWIITLGWTSIILVSIAMIDTIFSKYSEKARFIFYVISTGIIGVVAEFVVLELGIREYAPTVVSILSGAKLIGVVPVEALYYIPVFMALVITFSKYWENNLIVAKPQKRSGRK